ncbi:MAG: DegV family EDD domain-containing protein [Clostridia bacterium]|nr:DegV family EDD domain-containing protein [Deltaproteobacteria bacterium]
MRSVVVSHIGANLGSSLFDRLGVVVTTNTMIIDGKPIDTRTFKSTAAIDTSIANAKEFPHILSTSAGEYVSVFDALRQNYDEIMCVVSSRNSIGGYEAARAASRALKAVGKETNVHIIDSGSIDLGVGLVVLFTTASVKAGYGGERLVEAAEAFGKSARFVFSPQSLDYLVKGGRANFLAAQAAELLGRRVLLAHFGGTSHKLGTFGARQDPVTAITHDIVGNIGRGKKVWAAVMHGANIADAERLADRLRNVFDVQLLLTREVSPGVYLHGGSGVVGACVMPLDKLPWPLVVPELVR